MTAQLPAHLQNRQVKNLTERASEGMGGALPPHVSIQGNMFTFVDAAGNEMQPINAFSAVVIDIADRMNKRYYDKPYEPGSDEPPRCWSANGITPSREVASPIAPQCEGCRMNERGSAISRISQATIKACRDEKWIAFIVPGHTHVIFRLVLTPGSFKNWGAYTQTLKGHGVELSLALTQFSFVPKETGMLEFKMVDWIDEPTLQAVEAANREGKTDALVGRSDPIRQPALAAPNQMPGLQAGQPVPLGGQHTTAQQQEVIPPNNQFQQGAAASATPFGHTPAGGAAPFSGATPNPAQTAATTSPSEPPRRRRRSAGEAAPASAPAAAPFGQPAQAAPQAPFGQTAPAAPAAAPFGQPAAPAPGQFGIGGAAPVNAEMADMLAKMGFKQTNAA